MSNAASTVQASPAVPPSPPSAPARVYKTLGDVMKAIEEVSGFATGDLPIGDGFTWYPGPDGRPAFFQRSGRVPMNKALVIVAMFQGSGEVRVYALADGKGGDSERDKPTPPTRYTLAKLAPVCFTERMDTETFISEVADELSTLSDNTADYFADGDDGDKDSPTEPVDEPDDGTANAE